MANDNEPRGLLPLRWPYTPGNWYRVSTAADIYIGMPVQLAATGYAVGIGTPTGRTLTHGVALAFAGPLKGAPPNPKAAGYLNAANNTTPTGGDETGDRYVFVADSPMQEYVVQEDTGGTALVIADAGSGFDLLYRGAGANIVNGNVDSGWANLEVDRSTVSTGTGVFVQILRLHEKYNTDGTLNTPGNYCKWVVRFLHHSNLGANVANPLI